MRIEDILKDLLPLPAGARLPALDIRSLALDSRKADAGTLFFAVQGATGHGAKFIPDVLAKGVKAVVTDLSAAVPAGVREEVLIRVPSARDALRKAVLRFYGDPSSTLRVVGVTGTNGKTTITYLLESIFQQAGRGCGVVGTVNHRFAGQEFPSHNTTPGLLENQDLLARMLTAGAQNCVMEVSSHALDQGRVDLITFREAVFTNLTSDHMDYHKTREDYFLAKSKLFTGLSKTATALINIDDEFGPRLAQMTPAKVMTYGVRNPADLFAERVELKLEGSQFLVRTAQGTISAKTRLIGLHNVYNILAAVGTALAEGLAPERISQGIERLTNVPGRLDRIEAGQDYHVFVDYAHTEDALVNILSSIRHVSRTRVILVFGCGGDRDRTKRPKMGKVASEMADEVIITNDNPRSEDPGAIAETVAAGCVRRNFSVVLDRKEAIHQAMTRAGQGDVIIIAGKGHEGYQIFKDRTIDFSDHEAARRAIAAAGSRDRQGPKV